MMYAENSAVKITGFYHIHQLRALSNAEQLRRCIETVIKKAKNENLKEKIKFQGGKEYV